MERALVDYAQREINERTYARVNYSRVDFAISDIN